MAHTFTMKMIRNTIRELSDECNSNEMISSLIAKTPGGKKPSGVVLFIKECIKFNQTFI